MSLGTVQEMNFFSVGNCKKLFFSRTLQTWPHLLKKPLMENLYFVLWMCVINYIMKNMLLKNISNRICQHRNRPFDRKSSNFSWFVQCYISWMLRFAFTRLLLNKACKLCWNSKLLRAWKLIENCFTEFCVFIAKWILSSKVKVDGNNLLPSGHTTLFDSFMTEFHII